MNIGTGTSTTCGEMQHIKRLGADVANTKFDLASVIRRTGFDRDFRRFDPSAGPFILSTATKAEYNRQK